VENSIFPPNAYLCPVMPFIITKKFSFEAAHFIPAFEEGHKCRRMHGHSFGVEIKVKGEIQPELGILMDFSDIKAAVKPIIDYLDHDCLNDLAERDNVDLLRNPTSENICVWLYKVLKPKLPILHSVTVHETCTSGCEYFEN
jgi:6-pyruvoyltetrahydropterin/6-carboxytetrahydropterin synthase